MEKTKEVMYVRGDKLDEGQQKGMEKEKDSV